MAIISLGTNPLIVGSSPVTFSPLPFRTRRTYLLLTNFTISNPNNIFSNVRIKALLQIPGQTDFLAPATVNLDISFTPSSFFYSFPTILGSNGEAFFLVERVSFRQDTAEADSEVFLEILYDDTVSMQI